MMPPPQGQPPFSPHASGPQGYPGGYAPPPGQGYGPPPGWGPGGMPPGGGPPPSSEAWYQSVPAVLLLLFCCFPVGLVLVWTSPKFSQTAKIAISAIFGVFTLAGVVGGALQPQPNVATERPTPGIAAPTITSTATATAPRSAVTAKPVPTVTATVVPIATLLSEYKSNEVRSDAQYKGKIIQTTGIVGEVKKDILGSIYVTLGTGAAFELPVAQCFFDDRLAQQAASLNKGSKITVRGRVEGLMMNVLIKDAEFVP